MAFSYIKDAAEVKAISIDFTDELGGDTIDSVVFTTDLTEDSSSNTDTVASITVSGGVAGRQYSVKATATRTSAGDDIVKAVTVFVIDEPGEAYDKLTTIAMVALQLGVTDETKLYLICQYIAEARAIIENYCNRSFTKSTLTEKQHGNGQKILYINRPPLVSLTSISYNGVALDADSYEIHNAEAGAIYNVTGVWRDTSALVDNFSMSELPLSERNLYSVVYDGGYVLPGNANRTLPHDVERACIELAKGMYINRANDANIKRRELTGVINIEYFGDANGSGIPPSIRSILDNHRLYS